MNAVPHPTFAEALRVWLKIGLLSFGGPAGQIALMHKELVEKRRWVSEQRFLHALSYCTLLPGPEAQQLATYIGWLLHGWRGGLVAGTLFVIPGFVVITALSITYASYRNTHWLDALFFGLKAAVLAIVLEALLRIARRALKNDAMRLLALLAFVAIFAFGVPFPLIVLGAGIIGYIGAQRWPQIFAAGGHGKAAADDGPYLDLREPEVDLGWRRALKVIALWSALWIAPVLVLAQIFGSTSVFVAIAGFFSRMAVVTFGGAYAVLAYVAQQAVESHHWLQPGEMLDGLAMAETTPGPLILVLTYVGFLAAFRDPTGLTPLAAGFLGGALTTWVTFVPCFLWIFLGAPYVERLSGNKALSGALTAITAAVVGVILNLSVWFALHVLFADVGRLRVGPLDLSWPVWSSLDLWALALAGVALLSVFRFKLGMIPTLAICAVLGFALRTAMAG